MWYNRLEVMRKLFLTWDIDGRTVFELTGGSSGGPASPTLNIILLGE